MKPIKELKCPDQPILLCDIDDTLTNEGRLGAEAYSALWRLHDRGVKIIPVTGRPAGWCELIARQWPVDGVIGENGAFYFRYHGRKMNRYYASPQTEENKEKLKTIEREVLRNVPGTALASDQFCRMFDLAIDFCEDVPTLEAAAIRKIVDIFHDHGATAKISSIHVNGWFGTFDKLTTSKTYLSEEFGLNEDSIKDKCIFIGDSPNDEPMFGFFDLSVGVANILNFKNQVKSPPKFVTKACGGLGFAEMAAQLIK